MKTCFAILILILFHTSDGRLNSISDLNTLSGTEMKVLITHLPMATIIFRDGTGNVTGFGGYMYEQLQWISHHLDFSLSMNVLETSVVDENFTDIWTEMRNLVLREKVDIACNGFPGLVFDRKLDLTVNVLSEGFGILTPYPVPRTSRNAIFSIFSRNVWITLVASIVACIAFIKLIAIMITKYLQKPNGTDSRGFSNLGEIIEYVLATLTNQGGYIRNCHQSIKMIAVVWCFATFVFVNIYSSCLTSYMSLIFQRPDINSFYDLAMAKDYDLSVVKGTNPEKMSLEAISGIWKDIGDKIRNCPEKSCTHINYDDAAKKVLEGNFVSILTVGYIKNYMFHTISSGGECRVTMAQETISHRHRFMVMNKKNPFVLKLNKASSWWHAYGFQNYWRNNLLREAPQCQLKYNSKGESIKVVDKARIKLEQLCGAFYVLFIGYLLALAQFLRERFIR